MALDFGRLGFGAAAIGNLYRAIPDADARAVIDQAWAAGLRYFDTAPHYGFGLSEKRLGAALAEIDPHRRAIISTKVGRRLDPTLDADLSQARQGFVSPEPYESRFDYSYDAVMRSYEASRGRLRRDCIDILYVHDIGRFAHGDAHEARMREFLDGGFRAMEELRRTGAVRAIGLGVNETAVCEEILAHADIDLILLAGRYTLLEQAPLDSLLPLCAARGVRIILGGPFNSGILAQGVRHGGPVHYDYGDPPASIVDRVRRIEEQCDRFGVPLGAAALQFPLAHPVVASVIPGIGTTAHLRSAIAQMAQPVPAGFWLALRDEGLIDARAPVPAGMAA
ncbi:aldo/keto reductase [Sphingomonas bisphenolicum]|uniref:D-threo-aldose 1-dehydrogenase n=1 Tax=Sphingomonas bisphenolicum TaxID=296544 RepID=A0ABN5WHK7_9SPHN|nr:aldo/keto reductase [Sphingomonas bisphenolicum]BBF71771.1 D-threo-aldose 1-dehydrogenase [Sphingomonas bisphenolicum]